jgi:hypothetical protein
VLLLLIGASWVEAYRGDPTRHQDNLEATCRWSDVSLFPIYMKGAVSGIESVRLRGFWGPSLPSKHCCSKGRGLEAVPCDLQGV